MVNKSINLLGESCPMLTLRALKELSRLKENESLVIRFNDPIAKIDLIDVSNFSVSTSIRLLLIFKFQFAIGPNSIFKPKKGNR